MFARNNIANYELYTYELLLLFFIIIQVPGRSYGEVVTQTREKCNVSTAELFRNSVYINSVFCHFNIKFEDTLLTLIPC